MGDHSCYVRSKRSLAIGRGRFIAMVQDAITSRLVAGPWRVHRRRLQRREIADPARIAQGMGSPALGGDDTRDLLPLLPDLGRATQDLCIVFEGFDGSNRSVSGDMRRYAYGDCPLVFLSLRTATSIDVTHVIGEDEEIHFADTWDESEDDDDEDDEDSEEEDDEEDDEDDEEDDEDDNPDENWDEEGDDQLSVRDLVVFADSGPEFADLDEHSHLLGFLGKHLGVLLVGERST